jgi:hypothetical protein
MPAKAFREAQRRPLADCGPTRARMTDGGKSRQTFFRQALPASRSWQ